MNHQELMDALLAAGFNTGWVVRDGVIVLWQNTESIPKEFAKYTKIEKEQD
jgi:hypothetical protein